MFPLRVLFGDSVRYAVFVHSGFFALAGAASKKPVRTCGAPAWGYVLPALVNGW